ncbi:radical SAM additional 4Fe4S-binding domain protein [Caldisphaera lagunensis DSM 15908]|uniref:Radical SAM additional 4Fe4S-binding domain protein n=1 Tax=Caldisphaera lagunensis (strain DSM 15908 / JCM 11604 / ANMR 0165 / IC-154) TaxID=1056495 RepID=L0ABP8_CALLD|nr:radical SAM/SPASM domain-containing protein [Caldisphaera lagunensis]AFZ70470.1 radical SAM additional 4Fe4S-binding domain protein [Caldisphaera lagunensis DSM 15908]
MSMDADYYLDKVDNKKGDIGHLLAGIRLLFNNPATKSMLRIATRDVKVKYENGEVKEAPLIYHALSKFVGENISECPLSARFLIPIIDNIIKFGIEMLNGDIEATKKGISDPAIRRGVALVMKGIGLYGVTVPQKMPAPFLIVWNMTNMCNLKCMHCYQRAGKPTPDELTLEEKLNLIDQLDKAGVASIALSGGEPTIHPDYYTIVKEISRRGIHTGTATNGWLFSNINYLVKAKESGLRYVEVSLDSADPKKHDKFRGVDGSWERAVKALENAVKLGMDHGMAVTITKLNYNEVKDLLDLAEEIGVKRVIFFNFVPTGRGKENLWLDLDPVEREKFMRYIYSEMKKREGIQIVSTAPQYGRIALIMSQGKEIAPTHFAVSGDPIVKAVAEFVGGCGAGRIYAAIQPNGDVAPCVFLPLTVGNIRQESFWKIWTTSKVFNDLRDRSKLKGFCNVCPYKNICGGCRARAYGYYNDYLAPDPGCIYNVKDWNKLKQETHVKLKEEIAKT